MTPVQPTNSSSFDSSEWSRLKIGYNEFYIRQEFITEETIKFLKNMIGVTDERDQITANYFKTPDHTEIKLIIASEIMPLFNSIEAYHTHLLESEDSPTKLRDLIFEHQQSEAAKTAEIEAGE